MTQEDESVRLSTLQHQRVALLSLCFVLGVSKQHGIALALRRTFDPLKD